MESGKTSEVHPHLDAEYHKFLRLAGNMVAAQLAEVPNPVTIV
jgi:hypothetical protein